MLFARHSAFFFFFGLFSLLLLAPVITKRTFRLIPAPGGFRAHVRARGGINVAGADGSVIKKKRVPRVFSLFCR